MTLGALDLDTSESANTNQILLGSNRNDRFSWIATQLGNDNIFFFQDGMISRLMFQEAIQCFINGQSIACILLAFSFIERSIAGRLLAIKEKEKDVRNARPKELLERAYKRKWISKSELEYLSEVCSEQRNSIAHIRPSFDISRHEVRATVAGKEPYIIIEEDARIVLGAAIKVLRATAI